MNEKIWSSVFSFLGAAGIAIVLTTAIPSLGMTQTVLIAGGVVFLIWLGLEVVQAIRERDQSAGSE